MAKTIENNYLQRYIFRKAKQLGAEIVGFASTDRWEEFKDTKPAYFPQNIFPPTKSVIVLGIPIFIPMLDTTPSIVYSELYNTTNRLLDDIAYKLTISINTKGFQTIFFSKRRIWRYFNFNCQAWSGLLTRNSRKICRSWNDWVQPHVAYKGIRAKS